MNVLEKKALAIFNTLGWKKFKGREKSEVILSIEAGDSQAQAILQIRQLPSQQYMVFGVASGSKDMSRVVGTIFGEPPSFETLLNTRLDRETSEIGLVEIESVSQEAVIWWQAQDNLAAIKALTAPPPPTGQPQLMHLAALAYLGDFNTLLDYQDIFRRGHRLNFVPMITPEMIDRAIDIAAERA